MEITDSPDRFRPDQRHIPIENNHILVILRRLPRRLHRVARALLLGLLAVAETAFAHEQQGVPAGLASGFLHPLTGLDHLAAMVAVGLWVPSWAHRRSGSCRSRFRWSWPWGVFLVCWALGFRCPK